MDGIQGNSPLNQQNQAAGVKETPQKKVLGKLQQGQSLFTVDKKKENNSVEYYKDFNGDGEITEDELYMVDRFTWNNDGTTDVKRFRDRDNDGYSDNVTDYKYDKDGKIVKKEVHEQEDINQVKKRQHLDHEVLNRDMTLIKQGLAVNGGAQVVKPGVITSDKEVAKLLEQSKLNGKLPNPATLKNMGFEKGQYMDMNGGVYYRNALTGEGIRVAGWHGSMIMGKEGQSAVCYTSGDGKFKHEVLYDENGNPLKGVIAQTDANGKTIYTKYKYSADGNILTYTYRMGELVTNQFDKETDEVQDDKKAE